MRMTQLADGSGAEDTAFAEVSQFSSTALKSRIDKRQLND